MLLFPNKKESLRKLNSLSKDEIFAIIYGKYSVLSFNWWQQKYIFFLLKRMSNQELFTLIHQKNLWGNPESVSGPGSTLTRTEIIRGKLAQLFDKLELQTILDIPCGDFNWMKHMDFKDIQYIGADIVPEIINENQIKYPNDQFQFLCLDLLIDSLPKVDLILCRDCLVHMSDNDVKKALVNIKQSGAKYLLSTSFPNHSVNIKLGVDYWRPLNLQKEPFNLPPPELLINEGHPEPEYSDKSLALWQIKHI